MLPIYASLDRPHMELVVQFWSSRLRRNINKMERILCRATGKDSGTGKYDIRARLDVLELISLDRVRLKGLLIETFNNLNGFTRAIGIITQESEITLSCSGEP